MKVQNWKGDKYKREQDIYIWQMVREVLSKVNWAPEGEGERSGAKQYQRYIIWHSSKTDARHCQWFKNFYKIQDYMGTT